MEPFSQGHVTQIRVAASLICGHGGFQEGLSGPGVTSGACGVLGDYRGV